MNRRLMRNTVVASCVTLCIASCFAPATYAQPTHEQVGRAAADDLQAIQQMPLPQRIETLEHLTKTQPYSWDLHNELRHAYFETGASSQSLQQIDIILAHSLMDDYMLHIASDWTLDEDNEAAVTKYLQLAREYPLLVHLKAACLIRAAQLLQDTQPQWARQLLLDAAAVRYPDGDPGQNLDQYHALAQRQIIEKTNYE